MKFWDSSALASLLFDEPHRAVLKSIRESDPAMAVWWGTSVELVSAAARRKRADELTQSGVSAFIADLRSLAASWDEIVPTPDIRAVAQDLMWAYPLRAADALQLAAALIAAEEEPSAVDFVCLDGRLAAAARREGFTVLP